MSSSSNLTLRNTFFQGEELASQRQLKCTCFKLILVHTRHPILMTCNREIGEQNVVQEPSTTYFDVFWMLHGERIGRVCT